MRAVPPPSRGPQCLGTLATLAMATLAPAPQDRTARGAPSSAPHGPPLPHSQVSAPRRHLPLRQATASLPPHPSGPTLRRRRPKSGHPLLPPHSGASTIHFTEAPCTPPRPLQATSTDRAQTPPPPDPPPRHNAHRHAPPRPPTHQNTPATEATHGATPQQLGPPRLRESEGPRQPGHHVASCVGRARAGGGRARRYRCARGLWGSPAGTL